MSSPVAKPSVSPRTHEGGVNWALSVLPKHPSYAASLSLG